MNSDASSSVTHPVAKVISAGAVTLFGMSVSDLAALAALVYSLILIGEWCWKKCGRPFCEARGWIQRKSRRADDSR